MSDSKPGLRNVTGISEISRRDLLRTTAVVAGGGALLASSWGVNAAPSASIEQSPEQPLQQMEAVDSALLEGLELILV